MKKGIDYTGLCVAFYCHDGQGNYLFHKRSDKCRDEIGNWDCGGGSIAFGETVKEALYRELQEEFAIEPLEVEELGYSDVMRVVDGTTSHWVSFRFRVLVDRDKVRNNEPEKHTELGWYTLDKLPSPLHSQVPHELTLYKDKLI